jgi:DMSO/TMAO reductase YedYZ molybdopterin-dependent catalytic subunit
VAGVKHIKIIFFTNLVVFLVLAGLASSCGQIASNSSLELTSQPVQTTTTVPEITAQALETASIAREIVSQTTETTAATAEIASQSTKTIASDPETASESTLKKASEITQYNISGYRLTIDGMVENPLTLTYESILEYPVVTRNVALICPGVWGERVDWTGVPVSTLLAEAAIQPGATELTFYASDGYSMALKLEEVEKPGFFLAFKRDGQTLNHSEGYPVRLVAEGMDGYNWVRWITRIEVTGGKTGS